jgi:hypothetical protein
LLLLNSTILQSHESDECHLFGIVAEARSTRTTRERCSQTTTCVSDCDCDENGLNYVCMCIDIKVDKVVKFLLPIQIARFVWIQSDRLAQKFVLRSKNRSFLVFRVVLFSIWRGSTKGRSIAT